MHSRINAQNSIISVRRLKDILTTDGTVPRPHQNTAKTSFVRAHPVEVRKTTVKFLENFAIQNAVVLPGRVPGFKNPDLLLLLSKKAIYGKYVDACLGGNTGSIPYLSFAELWRTVAWRLHQETAV